MDAKLQKGRTVVTLDQPDAVVLSITGGKGANLGRLFQRRYPVPPAFVVSTAAYAQFLAEAGLTGEISSLLARIDYNSIDSLELHTAQIRQWLETARMPAAVDTEIRSAYAALGDDCHVAVRSSGTAEDLAGTSFAGLHDTYLDIRGDDEVVEATRRCWASLWTARATGYRQRNGFDHFEAQLAVVVQKMISADVAGVMFTGNPRTAATDETLINATWGLGESLVQGIITPDEFVVQSGTLQILECSIGAKEKEIVREPATGRGVVTRDVSPERRQQPSLSDAQIGELTKLGRRVTEDYEGYPQDIEWAFMDGTLYLLQSRPITGVEFSWDADVDAWQSAPDDPFDIRTKSLADEIWTGAITPLHYSWTAKQWNYCFYWMADTYGLPHLRNRRLWKYHRATIYWDCKLEKELMCEAALPFTRGPSLLRLPAEWQAEAKRAPFGLIDYLKQQAAILSVTPQLGPFAWFKTMYDYFENRIEEGEGLSNEQLSDLSDDELHRYMSTHMEFEGVYNRDVAGTGLCYYFRDAMGALAWITTNWYDGRNKNIFTDLLTGTPNISATIREHIDLYHLAKRIRESKQLFADFKHYQNRDFFDQLQKTEEGREFAKEIAVFLKRTGHRGHSDRDICFPRYIEEPAALYTALEVHTRSEDDPMDGVEKNARIREAAFDDVVSNLNRKSLGFLKVEAFKFLHEYCLKTIELRDNEREYIDRYIYAMKRGYLEVNNRLKERGIFSDDFDFYMLTHDELFGVLHGTANMTLIRHKVAARRKNWDAFDRKEVTLPKFLHRNTGVVEAAKSGYDEEGRLVLSGFGTSRGEVVGTARIIKSLKEIGRVNKGEIMVTNSTDPGWTPVFALLSGVIVETGGILSHSGCLAREYGFPAAHIEHAVNAIPDGAKIKLNGEVGTVVILDA